MDIKEKYKALLKELERLEQKRDAGAASKKDLRRIEEIALLI